MYSIIPKALTDVIDEIGRLPGVGARTAERYAYFLLKSDQRIAKDIAKSLNNLHTSIKTCPVTFALISSTEDLSPLYSESTRNRQQVMIVEEPLDIMAIERTGQYTGTYHVLGGAISPIDGIGPEQLHIPELIKRLKSDKATEVILATNASVEGESTAIFIKHQIEQTKLNIVITRLAQGIPVGVDIEYADQITLTHALEGRRIL